MRKSGKSCAFLAMICTAAFATSAAAIQPGVSTIRVTAEQISRSPELTTFHLYNKAIRKTSIGSSIVTCKYIGKGGVLGVGKSWCEASYQLPKGTLIAEGMLQTRFFYQLVVSGGTGTYANVVGGQVITSAIGQNRFRLIFTLLAAGQ